MTTAIANFGPREYLLYAYPRGQLAARGAAVPTHPALNSESARPPRRSGACPPSCLPSRGTYLPDLTYLTYPRAGFSKCRGHTTLYGGQQYNYDCIRLGHYYHTGQPPACWGDTNGEQIGWFVWGSRLAQELFVRRQLAR